MRELIGIEEEHSIAEARALIDAHTERMPSGPAVAATLAQMLGLADGAATLAETAWAIRHVLVAHAADLPLVVVVDDIHWAEPTLLDLLEGLPAAIVDAPILVLCLGAPRAARAPPRLAASACGSSRSGPRTSTRSSTACSAARPRAYASASASASAGNPLFAEELVAMLLDEGVLRLEDGRCTIAGDLDALHLPPSVHALLGARLDRLDPESRATLERGAIDGEVFHRGAVVELSEPSRRPSVPAVLEALAAKELVRPAEPSFAGEVAYRFKHILLRDTAYQATAKRVRASLHEQFSQWLEHISGERVVEVEEIVGYHLEQSYRLLAELGTDADELGLLGDRSARHLAAAAQRARARGDVRAALRLFTTAAELSSSPADRARYTLLQGTVAREAMQYRAATEALTSVRADAARGRLAGARGSRRDRARLGEPAHRRGGNDVTAEGRRRARPADVRGARRRSRHGGRARVARAGALAAHALRRRGAPARGGARAGRAIG